MDREPGSPRGCKGSDTTERLTHSSSLGMHGNQSWVFIGRTDFEAAAPILWPPDAKS